MTIGKSSLIRVCLTGPPERPEPLVVLNVTSRSVSLQWAVPSRTGGAEITGEARLPVVALRTTTRTIQLRPHEHR